MNFFGHAVLASAANPNHAFTFGSMLPDFEGMSNARILNCNHDTIAHGVTFHHATDAAFHRAPSFVAMCSASFASMTDDGVARGPARAVAHVGVEMFLDGRLAQDATNTQAFIEALKVAQTEEKALEWSDDGMGFSRLLERLQQWSSPADYAEPNFVFDRLNDALNHRPRLAIHSIQADAVRRGVNAIHALVEEGWHRLIEETTATLRSFDHRDGFEGR